MLYNSDGLCPRFYGLPKIHKPGSPLRPIVSFVNSPTFWFSYENFVACCLEYWLHCQKFLQICGFHGHRVKYGLDHFLDHFWTIFGPFWRGEHTISTEGGVGVGWSLSILREGWEVECYYPGRGVRRTITTQGGVRGGCNGKHYWLMEL